MKSIRTNPRSGAPEGDERIRTAVCAPSIDLAYGSLRRLVERDGRYPPMPSAENPSKDSALAALDLIERNTLQTQEALREAYLWIWRQAENDAPPHGWKLREQLLDRMRAALFAAEGTGAVS